MANTTHRIVKTPNPSVWSLVVSVEASILASQPDFTPVEGTPYKDFPRWFKDNSYIQKWGDYTYIANEDGDNPGDVRLVFCKNFTPEENATPFRITESFGNHRWPAQLLALSFIKDHRFPRAVNGVVRGRGGVIVGPTYYVRRVYIPEINEGTKFIKEEFFSNKPLPIPSYSVPVVTEVAWDIPGASGSIEALHPDILIPHTQSATVGIVAGDVSEASGVIKGQFYPATNFEELSPYVLSQSNDFANGYYSVRLTAQPPTDIPDPSIQ